MFCTNSRVLRRRRVSRNRLSGSLCAGRRAKNAPSPKRSPAKRAFPFCERVSLPNRTIKYSNPYPRARKPHTAHLLYRIGGEFNYFARLIIPACNTLQRGRIVRARESFGARSKSYDTEVRANLFRRVETPKKPSGFCRVRLTRPERISATGFFSSVPQTNCRRIFSRTPGRGSVARHNFPRDFVPLDLLDFFF